MRKLAKITIALFVLLCIGGCMGYYLVFWPNTCVKDNGIILIYPGTSFEEVVTILQDKGYLKNEYSFRKTAKLKKYEHTVKSGRYQINNSMSNNSLINLLRSGKQLPVNFTFNNIRTLPQFAGVVSRQLSIDSVEFVNMLFDPAVMSRFNFTPETFIAMFIPNTYQIYWNTSAGDFLQRMNREYQKFWNPQRRALAQKMGLSPTDVITLASIIEEETVNPEEYPIIAGVYMNRLAKNIPLAACPTLKYALGDFTLKRILNKHTKVDSPYNTYKNNGLPPGPIRMSSIRVIDAVLNYQKHDYLYFCARSDFSGNHYFSRTLRQHNEYARQYHEALNKRKIY